jgi:hypothetical protein
MAPIAQRGQVAPPQSTSLSFPSCRWSAHWFVTHVMDTASQASLVQSLSPRHFFDAAQAGHVPPPQSTSVSFPSCRWSPH